MENRENLATRVKKRKTAKVKKGKRGKTLRKTKSSYCTKIEKRYCEKFRKSTPLREKEKKEKNITGKSVVWVP